MHLYFFVRGKFEQVELWKVHAQTAYWRLRRIEKKTGKDVSVLVQGALRPSVLGAYEYIFPREALAEVCAFFGIKDNNSYGFGHLGLTLRHAALRQIFGCRKIPKKILIKSLEKPSRFTVKEYERGNSDCVIPGVSLHVIGIKDDIYYKEGKWDFEQEGL
jgi:hypothetical protein